MKKPLGYLVDSLKHSRDANKQKKHEKQENEQIRTNVHQDKKQ